METIHTTGRRKVRWAILMMAIACISSSGATAEPTVNADMLSEIQRLYGLDQEQAIERLASESEAAEQYAAIRNLDIKDYAGAWFDAESGSLTVALTRPDHSKLVKHIGAAVVEATYTLKQLNAAKVAAINALTAGRVWESLLRRASVDVRANKVAIEVAPGRSDEGKQILETLGVDTGLIEVRETFGEMQFSGSIRGADPYRNEDYEPENPDPEDYWLCSIGASVVGGFITAGHCGVTGNTILRSNGTAFGTVADSTYLGQTTYHDGQDGAWISTTSTWTPKPQVNGYSDGTILINPEWSGYLSAPIGNTVCRYGEATGGPDCGTITDTGVSIAAGFLYLDGMTEACNIQMQDGDSGGPYLTASAQMQGTNVGTWTKSDNCNPAAYFQPVKTTLDEFNRVMLTTHGTNAPAIINLSCESTVYSNFFCAAGYKSQGSTQMEWSKGGIIFGTGPAVSGSCTGGQWNSVDVEAENLYGTGSDSISFYCYSGSPP